MIEGPVTPPASRRPWQGLSLQRLAEQARAAVSVAGRWTLPPKPSRQSVGALLWRLQIAERLLWVALGALGLYLVAELFVLQLRPPRLVVRPAPAVTPVATAATPADRLRPAADYRETLFTRNPFSLISPDYEWVGGEMVAKSQIAELTNTLTVVGINRGRVPEALIEDTAAQRTYFVKVGDEVNGLTVKAIGPDGVVVTYEGEEAILQ